MARTDRIQSVAGATLIYYDDTASWVGAVVPVDGQTADIRSPMHVRDARTIGLSAGVDVAGTGTVGTGGASSTAIVGSGTTFLTDFLPGDRLTVGANIRTVTVVTDDTHLTVANVVTLAAGQSYTFTQCAVYVDKVVSTNATLTIDDGGELIYRGFIAPRGTTITLTNAAKLTPDSSLAAGTPAYNIDCGAGNSATTLVSTGSANARPAIRPAVGSGPGTIVESAALGRFDLQWCDLELGNATTTGWTMTPASTQSAKMRNCRFFNIGRFFTGNTAALGASTNLQWNDNELVSQAFVPTASTGLFVFTMQAAGTTATGLREFKRNVFATATSDCFIQIKNNEGGFDLTGSIISRLETPANSADQALGAFVEVLIYHRKNTIVSGSNWNFVGQGGDTLTDCYFVNDEGPAQASEHQLMPCDTPNRSGVWRLKRYTFERSGPVSTGAAVGDITHLPTPNAGTIEVEGEEVLSLPMGNGTAPGHMRGRGSASATLRVRKSTLMIDYTSTQFTNDAGIIVGSSYLGYAGMLDQVEGNLFWCKAQPVSNKGFGVSYDRNNALGSVVADVLNSAKYGHNAYYNARSGTIYDAAGANGTAITGVDFFKCTTKPDNSTDQLLGTGTDETTQGPKFKDPTRCFATFDQGFLGQSAATAWATATAYVVGDIRSAQTSTWYGNAVINYRCVTGHTSNSGNATNGKPGEAAATSYRTNWEFHSAYLIREAVKAGTTYTDASLGLTSAGPTKALGAWVRAGWRVLNETLRNSTVGASADVTALGPTIGAIEMAAVLVAPVLDAASNVTATTADLSWSAATGGTSAYTYQAQTSTNGGGSWSNAGASTGGLSETLTGLTTGVAVQARIVVTDADSNTATSNSVAFTPTGGGGADRFGRRRRFIGACA